MMQTDSNNQTDLLAKAFACDLTRFAVLNYLWGGAGDGASIIHMPGLEGWNVSQDFHAYTHGTSGLSTNDCDLKMALYHHYFATQLAMLMDKLAATPDPLSPGQSLLDNTVILWGAEHGVATPSNHDAHTYSDIPLIVAGGCGGLFKMGRVLQCGGVPHNQLLTAIINAFEANQHAYNASYSPVLVNQFGEPAYAGTLNLA